MNTEQAAMKKQTALQELVQKIETAYQRSGDKYKEAHKHWLNEAKNLLPKERADIEDAFVAGDNRGKGEIPFNAEQYFTQTFNQ